MKEGYLRVSTVLQPFAGLKDIDPEVLANAASRGQVVHTLCEYIAENIPLMSDDVSDLVRKYALVDQHFEKELVKVHTFVESFQKWAEGKEFIVKPERLYDEEHMITGEVDMVYRDNEGNLVLVDLKTPANESKTWFLQGSAYSYMAKKAGIHINRIEFVKLSRTGGKPRVYHYQEDFALFLNVLRTYRYFYSGEQSAQSALDYL